MYHQFGEEFYFIFLFISCVCSWYHTVASSKSRNLACNLWFNPMLRFNDSDCDQHKQPLPDYDSLSKYKFSNDPLTKNLAIDNVR